MRAEGNKLRLFASAAPTGNPQGTLWIRRPWPLQFMAANGRRQNRRQQPAVGTADYIEHKIKSPSDASRAAEMWYNHSIHSTI